MRNASCDLISFSKKDKTADVGKCSLVYVLTAADRPFWLVFPRLIIWIRGMMRMCNTREEPQPGGFFKVNACVCVWKGSFFGIYSHTHPEDSCAKIPFDHFRLADANYITQANYVNYYNRKSNFYLNYIHIIIVRTLIMLNIYMLNAQGAPKTSTISLPVQRTVLQYLIPSGEPCFGFWRNMCWMYHTIIVLFEVLVRLDEIFYIGNPDLICALRRFKQK